MRGFPLLSALSVALLFALAWGPLRWVASNEPVSINKELASTEPTVRSSKIRIIGTGILVRVKVQYLGQIIFDKGEDSTFEQDIETIVLPKEGLDLWVEAEFAGKDKHSALAIEIDFNDGDSISRSLWGKGGVIADSVFFQKEGE